MSKCFTVLPQGDPGLRGDAGLRGEQGTRGGPGGRGTMVGIKWMYEYALFLAAVAQAIEWSSTSVFGQDTEPQIAPLVFECR